MGANASTSVCVRKRLSEQIRRAVLSLTGEVDIRLHELPFYPSRVSSSPEATDVDARERSGLTIA
jgi:hypothetical protein